MAFSLGVPQIIYLAIVVFNITYAGVHHGEPQGEYNVWISLCGSALSLAIMYWGGFFA